MAAESKQSQPLLSNQYIARLAAQERPCFVCNKFTSVILTSADNSNADWFYVCRTHLGDSNFCSKSGGSPPQPVQKKKEQLLLANRLPESDSVGDLVSNVGSAWKSWRESGNKSQDDEDKYKKDQDDKKKPSSSCPTTISNSLTPPPPSPPPQPTSPQQPVLFVIQRDYFYLRQREFKTKIQKKEASEKLKTLQFPEVPKTLPNHNK